MSEQTSSGAAVVRETPVPVALPAPPVVQLISRPCVRVVNGRLVAVRELAPPTA